MRRTCLAAALMPQRLDWWSEALCGDEQPGLLLALASVSRAAIDDQLQQHRQAADALGVRVEHLDHDQLLEREAQSRSGQADWLLRLGVLPAEGATLLADPALAGVHSCLAAGAGMGLAWAEAKQLPSHRVETLRRRCKALGGALSVLQQPPTARLAAWDDSPARPVIEAVKREFDPLQQLARGRLPGVNQAGVSA
jgi:glycolate oxidase FAD binding subunit